MVSLENGSTGSRVNRHPRRCGSSNWTGINIAAMVAGFVLFWPLGLFMVNWITIGRDARELPGITRDLINKLRGSGIGGSGSSGNRIFNEFQQTQYDRIQEIKTEIQERSKRFHDFREEQKRKQDQDEFNRFMTLSPAKADQ